MNSEKYFHVLISADDFSEDRLHNINKSLITEVSSGTWHLFATYFSILSFTGK